MMIKNTINSMYMHASQKTVFFYKCFYLVKQVHYVDIVCFVSAVFTQDVVYTALQVNSIIQGHQTYSLLQK